jgi:hypothetical protein
MSRTGVIGMDGYTVLSSPQVTYKKCSWPVLWERASCAFAAPVAATPSTHSSAGTLDIRKYTLCLSAGNTSHDHQSARRRASCVCQAWHRHGRSSIELSSVAALGGRNILWEASRNIARWAVPVRASEQRKQCKQCDQAPSAYKQALVVLPACLLCVILHAQIAWQVLRKGCPLANAAVTAAAAGAAAATAAAASCC